MTDFSIKRNYGFGNIENNPARPTEFNQQTNVNSIEIGEQMLKNKKTNQTKDLALEKTYVENNKDEKKLEKALKKTTKKINKWAEKNGGIDWQEMRIEAHKRENKRRNQHLKQIGVNQKDNADWQIVYEENGKPVLAYKPDKQGFTEETRFFTKDN